MNRSLSLIIICCVTPAWGDAAHLRLAEPGSLSPATRAMVRAHMDKHEKLMSDLVWGVILLDYPMAERSANAIAKTPPLDPSTTDLEALGRYFFEQQDLLARSAARLGHAAHERDGVRMGAAYKVVVETCVNCHLAYLNPPATN